MFWRCYKITENYSVAITYLHDIMIAIATKLVNLSLSSAAKMLSQMRRVSKRSNS